MVNFVKYLSMSLLLMSLGSLDVQGQKKQPPAEPVKEEQFNPLQDMGGSRRYTVRDDYVWGTNTAFTTNVGAADISMFSQSRYGLNKKMELSSNLLLCAWAPNLFLKYRYKMGKVWIASRHGLYFPTMALKFSNKNGYLINHSDSIAIPFVTVIRNELILSYPFFDKLSCNSTQPYLILSAIGGIDYGFASHSWDAQSFSAPWLQPRRSALLGRGFTFNLVGRLDYMYYDYLKFEVELGLVKDDFSGVYALENRAVAKYFLYQNLSISGGWMFSYASSPTQPKFGIIPFMDLTLYLGSRPNKAKGLWKNKMF